MNRLDKLKIKHKGGNNMNREQAKELLPIIQAFAEGKTIQVREDIDWCYLGNETDFNLSPQRYRIKSEPKYRPFANAEECWQEMLKHQPFWWVKASHGYFHITGIRNDKINLGVNNNWLSYEYILSNYKFVDGTPFGIKEE